METDFTGTLEELARKAVPHRSVAEGPAPALLVSLTATVGDDPLLAVEGLFDALRHAASKDQVRALGQDQGFRLEDLELLVVGIPPGVEPARIEAWLRRRLSDTAPIRTVEGAPGKLTLAGALRRRLGFAPSRPAYQRTADGRVRLEAFELHIAEHCNLRCANCCNMSPLVDRRFLSMEEVTAILDRVRGAVLADVVKIMGGEPLLHPRLVEVLRALRATGVGQRVRLFTNGLLLHTMKDDFWEEVEDLTISNYVSAPVKPAILELARQRARRHGFVLNVKPVSEFSQVLSPKFQHDDAVTARTFTHCWLRHRCVIARNGRFFMCTRAAYAEDFLRKVDHEPAPAHLALEPGEDGIPLDAPDLAERIEAYMNREAALSACRYCLGGDGPSEPHHQLTRQDVEAGRLSRGLARKDP